MNPKFSFSSVQNVAITQMPADYHFQEQTGHSGVCFSPFCSSLNNVKFKQTAFTEGRYRSS